jgi:hypothetical protein
MKSLLIIGYNSLKDGFLTCANYFSHDYEVSFFPLLYYKNNNLDIVKELINCINAKPIDYVFLWYHEYFASSWATIDQFYQIKRSCPQTRFIGYNWDPLIRMEISIQKLQLIRLLDHYISGDGKELKQLSSYGYNNIAYGASGFDPKFSYQGSPDPNYTCDVSIVCTNLYNDTNMFPPHYNRLNRKFVVDTIYNCRKLIKFHIYGPPSLQILYPECYKGSIDYNDCYKVFSNSRINLCIHVVSYNNNGSQIYFSERLVQILGCRGLLYCETNYNHLLLPGVNYILADPIDPCGQILHILRNYDNYQNIRNNGYDLALKSLTWDSLRATLGQIISMDKSKLKPVPPVSEPVPPVSEPVPPVSEPVPPVSELVPPVSEPVPPVSEPVPPVSELVPQSNEPVPPVSELEAYDVFNQIS